MKAFLVGLVASVIILSVPSAAYAVDEECGGCRVTLMGPLGSDDDGEDTVSDCKDPSTITCSVDYPGDYPSGGSGTSGTPSGGSTPLKY